MSTPVVGHLDFGGSVELRRAVIGGGATRPASPVAGQLHFDTVNARLEVYSGSGWLTLAVVVDD